MLEFQLGNQVSCPIQTKPEYQYILSSNGNTSHYLCVRVYGRNPIPYKLTIKNGSIPCINTNAYLNRIAKFRGGEQFAAPRWQSIINLSAAICQVVAAVRQPNSPITLLHHMPYHIRHMPHASRCVDKIIV